MNNTNITNQKADRLSDDALTYITGGVTRQRRKAAIYDNLICNKCYWEPKATDIKCTIGCKCPNCNEGTMIHAVG